MKFLTVCLIMGGLSLNGAGVEPDDSDRALAGAAVHPGDGAGVSGSELVLAEGGASRYRIVVPQSASPSERHGARELQMFLAQITGASLPVVTDAEPPSPVSYTHLTLPTIYSV